MNANIVRGNDNQIQQAFNSHDLDATVHVQSSALADRPAAGVVGRTWVTNDSGTYEHWYDDGTSWQRIYGVDYEEGTWTPTYFAATTDFTSVTYDPVTSATYVRVNNYVWVSFFIRTDAVSGGSGNVSVTGIPFVPAIGRFSIDVGQRLNWGVNHPCAGLIQNGNPEIRLLYASSASGSTPAIQASDLGTTTNDNLISAQGFYQIA